MTMTFGTSDTSPIQVAVDPRIELMSVIQLLTDYFLVSRYETSYHSTIRSTWHHFIEHPAVQLFAAQSWLSFNYDAVPRVFLALTDPPALQQRTPFPDDVLERAGGVQSLESWLVDLRDFAEQSHFMAFFDAQRLLFDAMIEKTRPVADAAIGPLRSYLGTPLENCRLVLGMLLHHGGFGPTITPLDGPEEHYALIGPVGSESGMPTFGSAEDIAAITWHEWSHTVINPLADAQAALIAQSERLYQPIAQSMYAHGYASWHITVIEHIINAITTRLTAIVFGEEASATALEHLLDDDYRYLPPLIEKLKEYEAQRERYPTIGSFLPMVLEAI